MSQDMRILSSKLLSKMYLIPAYNISKYIFGLPSKNQVETASRKLIFIHNGHDSALVNQGILNSYAAQEVRNSLGIYTPKDEYMDTDDAVHYFKAK